MLNYYRTATWWMDWICK